MYATYRQASSRAELGYAGLFIEVRPDTAFEFFIDTPTSSKPKEWKKHDVVVKIKDERMRDRIERAFGQHIAYATEIQARQQQLCLFSVSFCGSHARLFRWDRSGIIVSRSFDAREQPELLCEFLARYACASHTDRGHDQTVEMATLAEDAVYRDVVSRHVEDQLGLTGDDLAGVESTGVNRIVREWSRALYVGEEGWAVATQFFIDRPAECNIDVLDVE